MSCLSHPMCLVVVTPYVVLACFLVLCLVAVLGLAIANHRDLKHDPV